MGYRVNFSLAEREREREREKGKMGWWWQMPLIPALGGRDSYISLFEASLVYKVNSRTAKAT